MSPLLNEERDAFLSKLRAHVEVVHQVSGHKAVILAHSMAAPVAHFFLQWAEHKQPGTLTQVAVSL